VPAKMPNARQITLVPMASPKAGFSKPEAGFLLCVASLLVQGGTSFFHMHHLRPAHLALQAHDRLGILSFDLDDTLFSTTDVVRAANEKMIQAMIDRGLEDASIPDFLDATRSIRSKLENPVTYQALRKKAIQETFQVSPRFDSNERDMEAVVDDCYDAWEQERHSAAERFLFPDVIETMKELRSLYPDTCFVAITNGAGDPLKMLNTLAPFFDFRVSGEDDDVFPYRKPHSFIYEYAVNDYNESGDFADGSWCHVGDCLANDVGASAACGAQAIWMCLEDDKESAASRLVSAKNHPAWSTATPKELEKRMKQVEEGKKSVAATIYKLSELPAAISIILEKPR
jgi:FMN phosphatase YigB (HAD superfamily)